MKHSEILKEARIKIQMGHNRGICAAVSDDNYGFKCTQIKSYISHALAGHNWLDDWVRYNRPNLPRDSKSMRKYRLQWIDWMIEQYESTGR